MGRPQERIGPSRGLPERLDRRGELIESGAARPEEEITALLATTAPTAAPTAYELHDGPIVASGEMVVTEHAETWTWDDDHSVRLPFTSVQEIRDAKVVRWWDYLDLATLTNAAPPWWLDHIAPGYK